ncbi:MAG: two-component system sensor histidine kinase CreC [Acidiferrobacterales bacterium]|nr:two-component system sensor histidine kinase CreC [Acidiferrobacterales bacterium]
MKISYSLRAFAIYFVILGSLIWFTLDNAIERLNDGMRQSAESVLVDMANVLASLIENQLGDRSEIDTALLENILADTNERNLSAQIYQVTKTIVDSQVYVTDAKGIVVYDSNNQFVGEDFSQWRDVRFTLDGKYGARTSFIDSNKTEPEDPKAMVIAAPIIQDEKIVGVLSVLKPINALEGHLLTETQQLQSYAFALLLFALLLGYLLSLWFTHSLNRIANYANDMAEGKKVEAPNLRDSRLADLSNSISNMRKQIDGKEYVENYVHSLTHELKTPITSIRGAVELMTEDMPAEDRKLFIKNINTSNSRMSRLVDRMLSLAKLESLTELVDQSNFDLVPTIHRLIEERHAIIEEKRISISYPKGEKFECYGDRVLISQAIANLLDNAIRFSTQKSNIEIGFSKESVEETNFCHFKIYNQGSPIPEFALPKLYDRFFSLPPNNEKTELTKSTGLGLSFVSEIMKLHHGKVSVNNYQKGVLSVLSWPIQ